MVAANAVQCILQGICLCAGYKPEKGDTCIGPLASYRDFGTGTDYRVTVQPYLNKTTVPIPVPVGCRPSLFYLFQRHTIRYPSEKNIKASQQLLPNIQRQLRHNRKQSKLCKRDVKAILRWNSSFPIEQENAVTESGRVTVREQVRRLRRRFPTVFTQREGLENVVVDFSWKGTRTKETAATFLREWYGDAKFNKSIAALLTEVNQLNTFHETCEAIMEKHGIDVTTPNRDRLMTSGLCKEFKKHLEKKLHLRLRKRDLKAMLTECQFGMAIDGKSPWCALFAQEDLKFAELLSDAEDYDEDAYGTPRNTKMACPVAVDLYSHIRNLSLADVRTPRVVLHFTHAGAFKKISPLFGLAESDQPAHDCSNRAWHSSRQSPFNANLNVVHFSCPAEHGNHVAVLLNEELIQIPGCSNAVCSIKEFEKVLDSKVHGCDLEKICSE